VLCKVFGRPHVGKGIGRFQLALGKVIEVLCWTCRYWLDTGKVYDVR